MKKGTWISIIPGLLSLSLSLGLVLILSNWTAFVLLRWPSYLWFLLVAAFSFIPFFIVNHWLTKSFEALSQPERNVLYLVLFAFITFVFLAQFPDLQSTFMTWATLMLASIAFGSIMYSMDQARKNERLRKKDREDSERLHKEDREESERLRKEARKENRSLRQEERDREFKRHNLEMINNWAQEVLNHLREVHPINDKNDLWKLERIAWRLQLNSVFLRQMHNLFDKKFNTNLINSIDDFSKYGDKIFEIISTLRLDEQVPEADRKLIKDLEHKSFKSITDLIYAITNTKIKLKI